MIKIHIAVAMAMAALAGAPHVHAQSAGGPPDHAFGASRPIEGQYIVVFKRDLPEPAQLATQLAAQHGAQVLHTYGQAIQGFSARMSAQAAAALSRNPNVASVEQDATVSLHETPFAPVSQPGATWGLDRIDQRSRPLSGSYAYQYSGAGVYAFVIDTGIFASHSDFGGRVAAGAYVISDGNFADDCNGHGTHVAGTIGGSTWGVAKGVTLVPVRVLDCSGSGSWSGIIAGIDWVAGQGSMRPAVANMSLGGGKSSSVNSAVAGAVAKGVTMVVAAGNSNANACNYSPASEPSAITVGATTSSDARASYSNYGSCLDLFAPGSSITSAWPGSTTTTNTISGTSMASPHVAGVAALALAANPTATPAAVASFLVANATANVVGSAGSGSPNRMVYSLATGAPATQTTTTVAVSSITGSASKSGSKWTARATVTVQRWDGSALSGPVSGATVTGTFSPGATVSCVTQSTGQCTLSNSSLSTSSTSTRLTVGKVSGTNLVYDATKNVATTLVINRP